MNCIKKIINTLLFLAVFALQPGLSIAASITVTDDEGNDVTLVQPARRIICLSPALTELVYAAGGGDYIKGVVSFSNYPDDALKLPQVGSYNALDLEKILLLQPDLVIAWKSGNPALQISKLKKLGIPVYLSEPVELTDIPLSLLKLGQLMGTEKAAGASAAKFNLRFERLKSAYTPDRDRSRVFIQIWDKPLMSVSGKHLISKVVRFCGGENIFAHYSALTLTPDIETVLQRDPQIILVTGMAKTNQQWLARWKQWEYLDAVKHQRLYAVNPDLLVRHTPRILDGIEAVCELFSKSGVQRSAFGKSIRKVERCSVGRVHFMHLQ